MGKMSAFQPIAIEIVRQGSVPDAPESLDVHGATLWRAILAQRCLTSPAELTILEHACQCHGRAESLRRLIAVHGELIETADGNSKVNGLLTVELQCRALCSRLLGKLVGPEDKPRMGRPPGQKPSF
jgi:hypothetical protein